MRGQQSSRRKTSTITGDDVYDPSTIRLDLSRPISMIGTRGWCHLHQSLASARDLNRIGSISGPVTTKWSLMKRRVRVVIAGHYAV
jgi:hypothetical protein